MVIAPGRGGISAFVILADNELIPSKFNDERVVVMRKGASTDNELVIVKAFGVLVKESDLRKFEAPICPHSKIGDPLHEHADGTWWFYDATWVAEAGPFLDYDSAWDGLKAYCILYQKEQEKVLTNPSKGGMLSNELREDKTEAEGTNQD